MGTKLVEKEDGRRVAIKSAPVSSAEDLYREMSVMIRSYQTKVLGVSPEEFADMGGLDLQKTKKILSGEVTDPRSMIKLIEAMPAIKMTMTFMIEVNEGNVKVKPPAKKEEPIEEVESSVEMDPADDLPI